MTLTSSPTFVLIGDRSPSILVRSSCQSSCSNLVSHPCLKHPTRTRACQGPPATPSRKLGQQPTCQLAILSYVEHRSWRERPSSLSLLSLSLCIICLQLCLYHRGWQTIPALRNAFSTGQEIPAQPRGSGRQQWWEGVGLCPAYCAAGFNLVTSPHAGLALAGSLC